MKICVIGAGNTGHGISAYLADKGADVILNTRSQEKADHINANGITSAGSVTGNFKVPATTDLALAVSEAELIIIMTVANAHKEVAERLKPVLQPNQKVIVFNSNWGAMQFKQVLGDDIQKKNLIVAETSAQLFVGSIDSQGVIQFSIKAEATICATDSDKTEELIAFTKEYFPQFKKANSIIETTISSTNPVIHVPVVLLNLARVEQKQDFLFYGDGVSPLAVKMVLALDRERIAVAKAMGCEITDVLSGINSFWAIKHDNLFDALTKNETYLKSKGPKTVDHRFLTEDVPYGIAPIAKIGKIYGVATPHTDHVVALLNDLLGDGILEDGVAFAREDFQ
ncbi:NAD/NADP octopine/nopaline dehydrogenase family protein [Chakrabartyella piscis]|uniref:NAD/NADP octopine/nopaline dehydrogenase family protein n=1 Tax=Chakrabartyella piscis TaxID=2918914 RepID=UPI002958C4B9|nr:NAD/NADP octopine/nopaline dehydrogenase family protein [Chakrabartyella piscis]